MVFSSGSPRAPKYRAACAVSMAAGFASGSGLGAPIICRTSLLFENKVVFSIPHLWDFINPGAVRRNKKAAPFSEAACTSYLIQVEHGV
jgi:hypothetical protein